VTGSDDRLIRVWDTLNGNERLVMSQDGAVTEVVVSSDGRWIATTGADKTARVWDAETGTELFQIPLKASGARLAFCNDDQWLISTDDSGAVNIWDVSNISLPALSQTFSGIVEHVQYSPSGEWLAVSADDKLWLLTPDPESILQQGSLGQPAQDFESNIARLVFSPGSDRLGILTEENQIAVYDLEARSLQYIESPARVQSIAFSPNGEQLITSDSDGNIQAWDALTMEDVSGTEEFPQGTAVASTGNILAIASQTNISLLDENGGFPSIETTGQQALLTFNQDGSLLASSNSSGEVTIFQNQNGEFAKVASFVKDQATSLAFHPNRALLAVGTSKYVYLMDTATGKEVARIPHISTVNGVSFSPEGSYLATSSSRSLNFWEMANIRLVKTDDLVSTTCQYLFENLSTAQWETFFPGEPYESLCENL
jgi:WD40 repeat protein